MATKYPFHRQADLSHRGVGAAGFNRQFEKISVAPRAGLEGGKRAFHCGRIAFGLEFLELFQLAGKNRTIVHGENGDVVLCI